MNEFALKITSSDIAGDLIDTHSHCGGMDLSNFYKNRYPCDQNILDLEIKRVKDNVAYQVVFPMPTSIYYDIPKYWRNNVFLPSGYSDFPFQRENYYLLSAIKHLGLKNMLPFAAFSLRAEISKQEWELLKLAKEYPIYGLKYHTKVEQMGANEIDQKSEFVEIARLLDIPIIIHTEKKGCSNAIDVLELADRNRDVRFCVAHMGGFAQDFFNELGKYQYDNVFVDTCPLLAKCKVLESWPINEIVDLNYGKPKEVLEYLIDRFPQRVLWGTDSPWTYYGKLDGKIEIDIENYGYHKEACIVRETGKTEIVMENTLNYLFGMKGRR